MLDAYLDYSYYLVYIFYFEILEEKNHDFFENWELMIHAIHTFILRYKFYVLIGDNGSYE